AADHVLGGGRSLVERIVPVLQTGSLAQESVEEVGDIAGGVDARSIGLAVLVDDDTVASFDAGGLDQADVRLDADADDHEIALKDAAVAADDPPHARVALEAVDGLVEAQVDAVLAMDIGVDVAQVLAQRAAHRHRRHLQYRDLQALHPRCGRDLCADEPGADDDATLARLQLRLDGVAVFQGAKVVDALQVRAGDVDPPDLAAGAEKDRVVIDAAAVVQLYLLGLRIE